ncbi:glycosyltransferase family 1 protein [Anabaena sp. FACHB-1391]|uniref:glycosyltransferase family 1 protein n=1 Tax=Anabaena sp. FACHB-1391 TaxID=2692771 RepID=UPI001681A548|nr:glycosyltransferase family 1 protein [Anabaena sp. FACHB-1391]
MLDNIKKGFFISASVYVSDAHGGVQRCTREYLAAIKAAGWNLEILPYSIDRQWQTRLLRKLKPSSFYNRIPQSFISDLVNRVISENISWVFLNQVDSLPIVPHLKQAIPNVKIVLLSHGAQFVDEFLAAQSIDSLSIQARSRLANTILDEMSLRQSLDHVFTLSEEETVFEQWLGAKSVSWLPRAVSPQPLDWRPILGRVGFVGTLEHTPNYEGLVNVLNILQKRNDFDGCIRIVSSSESLGNSLTKRFSFVEYLGRLSNEALHNEALTWCWFIHPLFCWSRGCSTKLADALEWQIPVLTTEAGCRGYTWKDGNVVKVNTVKDFCSYLVNFNSIDKIEDIRSNVILASSTSPSIDDVADKINHALWNYIKNKADQ